MRSAGRRRRFGWRRSQPPEQFSIAERDRGLQARARLHLGQIHHRIDQARPPARGDMPGRRVQPDPSGLGSFLARHHLGSRDRLITIPDFDVPGRTRIGHRMPPENRRCGPGYARLAQPPGLGLTPGPARHVQPPGRRSGYCRARDHLRCNRNRAVLSPAPVTTADTMALRLAESPFLCASADERRGSVGRNRAGRRAICHRRVGYALRSERRRCKRRDVASGSQRPGSAIWS